MPVFKKNYKATYVSSFEETYGNKHILRPGFHCVKHAVPFFQENFLIMNLRGITRKMQQKGCFGIQGTNILVSRFLNIECSCHLPLHESSSSFITSQALSSL